MRTSLDPYQMTKVNVSVKLQGLYQSNECFVVLYSQILLFSTSNNGGISPILPVILMITALMHSGIFKGLHMEKISLFISLLPKSHGFILKLSSLREGFKKKKVGNFS